jgi:hypothetical protein
LNRTMRFESLEDRSMLSVSAVVSSHELAIFGTSANESVLVYEQGTNWKVQGIGGTKVNNSTKAQSFAGVENIEADLGAGNDFLKVFNGTVLTLQVDYGSSDTGFKTTQVINLQLTDGLSIVNESNGSNSILVNNMRTTFEGASFELLGNGNNVIVLANLKLFGGTLELSAGSGNNVISATNIQTTGGNKDLIETGDGNDIISISQFSATGDLDISSGGGTDAVVLNRVNMGDNVLSVDVGPGNYDVLTIIDSTAKVADLSDTGGTNGFLIGVKNDFDEITIDPNFTHVSGIENTPC